MKYKVLNNSTTTTIIIIIIIIIIGSGFIHIRVHIVAFCHIY